MGTRLTTVYVIGSESPQGRSLLSLLKNQVGIQSIGIEGGIFTRSSEASEERLRQFRQPDLIIHCHDLHHLDQTESNPAAAWRHNVDSISAVSKYAESFNIPVILSSSNLVFDGRRDKPYLPSHPTKPVTEFGKTKWASEELLRERMPKHIILRSGWLLENDPAGWLQSIVTRALEGQPIAVSDEVQLAPTATDDLSRVMLAVLKQLTCGIDVWGVYHYSGLDTVSYAELVDTILDILSGYQQVNPVIEQASESQLIRSTLLPMNGTLNCLKLRNTFGIKQLSWKRFLPGLVEDCYDNWVESNADIGRSACPIG
ncbi:hypothetical protein GCM10022278_29110 [Allohahella marinimesophila]|uniref:dTDP-4-dehydrorhamnose reductase n=1 Tax=Allohahella marinimesophila TaxID=1054972 RepID=A0ABP7PR73_9GAMM